MRNHNYAFHEFLMAHSAVPIRSPSSSRRTVRTCSRLTLQCGRWPQPNGCQKLEMRISKIVKPCLGPFERGIEGSAARLEVQLADILQCVFGTVLAIHAAVFPFD